MTETGQIQRTLAIVRGAKGELANLLEDAKISIILEKPISLSVADAKDLTAKNADLRTSLGSKPAHGYVLEADSVIQRWLDLIKEHDETGEKTKKKYLYGSPSQATADQDIAWLRRLTLKQKKSTTGPSSKLPTSTATRKIPSTTTTTTNKTTAAAGSRRAAAPPQTHMAQKPTSLGDNRLKAQPKQTAKTTVKESSRARIPQRPQRDNTTSKTRRRKTATTTRHHDVQHVKNDSGDNKDIPATTASGNTIDSSNVSDNSSSVSTAGLSEEPDSSKTATQDSSKEISENAASSDVQSDTPQDAQTIPSCTSSGSGDPQPSKTVFNNPQEVAEDAESEHDAEVAAAINHTSNIPATTMDQSVLRASLSPNSVTSLPRPETPEVDQLRQRFESFGQVKPANSAIQYQHRKSLSPEATLNIKDTRPKTPSGKRVKNMVNFFMDENLHKWEF